MNPSYESYKNAGEKKMKGLEASVEYQINSLLTSQIHYDYMKIDESITGQTVIYESGNTTDATSVVHGSTQPQPVFRFTAKLETPSEYGFYVLNTHPLGGFSMNFLYTWRKGETFQWQNKDISWRPFQNMDLRIAKYIAGYKKVKAEFYVNIFNLFNNKNMQTPKGYIYDNEGNLVDIEGSWSWAGKSSIYNWPWWQDEFTKYMNSLDIVGGDRPGDYPHDGKKSYIDMPGFTPWTFLEKRDVFVGFKFSYQF